MKAFLYSFYSIVTVSGLLKFIVQEQQHKMSINERMKYIFFTAENSRNIFFSENSFRRRSDCRNRVPLRGGDDCSENRSAQRVYL